MRRRYFSRGVGIPADVPIKGTDWTTKNNIVVPPPELIASGLKWNVNAGIAASYPGSGTTWYDLSTSAVNATLTGGPGYTGADGGAITFDAVDDWAPAPLNITSSQGTVSVWAYPTSAFATGRRSVFCNYNGSPYSSWSHALGFHDNGAVTAYIFDGGTKTVLGTTTLSLNTWVYLTMTWQNSGYLKVYINGGSYENQVAIGTSWTGGNAVYLGGGCGGWGPFGGRIGAGHVYNVALDSSQILNNYNATKTRFGL